MFPYMEETSVNELREERSHPSYDDYRVELNLDQATHFPIDVQECSNDHTVTIRGHSGIIYLVNNQSISHVYSCKWEIIVSGNHFVAARFEVIPDTCRSAFVRVYDNNRQILYVICSYFLADYSLIYSSGNSLAFGMLNPSKFTRHAMFFLLFFTTVARNGRLFLPATMTSFTTGYVTSTGFGGTAGYSQHTNATYDLTVPLGHVVMISFSRLDLAPTLHKYMPRGQNYLEIHVLCNGMFRVISVIHENEDFRPKLFNASSILLRFIVNERGYTGFKMDFSFHPVSDAPVVDEHGLFDCSCSKYETFKQHVHCDMVRDCTGGEDEGGHCPFSSQLCNGSVVFGTKCYMLFWNEGLMEWHQADQACKSSGGHLATLKSAEERKAVEKVFVYSSCPSTDDAGYSRGRVKGLASPVRWYPAWVGLRKTDMEPSHTYGREWAWSDGVVAYNTAIDYLKEDAQSNKLATAFLLPQYPSSIFAALSDAKKKLVNYICEFAKKDFDMADQAERSTKKAVLPDLADNVTKMWSTHQMTECPSGHVTFSFMSCDTASDCGTEVQKTSCTMWYHDESNIVGEPKFDGRNCTHGPPKNTLLSRFDTMPTKYVSTNYRIAVTVSMFVCSGEESTMSYSLVCDYIPHCSDKSDETFCNHGNCDQLTCASGQCFSFSQKCDNVVDCLDGLDEENCLLVNKNIINKFTVLSRLPPPTIVDFDGHGNFIQLSMQDSENCPETHFRCATVASNCLPVYLRCNDVYDCPDREDEEDCDRYMCPGFYRCRASRVCVHVDHVCDGWPQCLQRDDELYCELTCPSGCLCQGLAFVCNETFPLTQYPELRYLDASRSNMQPEDLSHNKYLIWLSLVSCDIQHVSGVNWPNLIHLDLSQNFLSVVSMDSFLNLPNLRTLSLAFNPLVSLLGGLVCLKVGILKFLDLSHTFLREFNSHTLSCFPQIAKLNISYSQLDTIDDNGLKFIPNVISIDIRGSPVSTFPSDIFRRLSRLQRVFATNCKFCCKATLPKTFDDRFCIAPEDEISSCDDLLKSDLFRGCLWMFAILSVIGNVGCFLIRFLSTKRSRSGFNMFVTNLTVADVFMGVYLVMIGVADELYRGQYLWHEKSWTTSTACTVAGFLSLLSSEMSAFIICIITLDRFIVLTFPFSGFRFKGWSLTGTCVLIWTASFILASVPLFPMTTGWEFYGQSGICIPLPITRGTFQGHGYAFGVMIVLNFVLFVFIAVGQMSIYWSVRVNSMTSDSSRKSKDFVIARRLFSVAVSDFLCWFPIGLLGLLSSNDVPVSSDVSVAMAIFVLPLNSTLNPFLYTFNVVIEKRRKAYETELIKTIESIILSQETPTTADVGGDEDDRITRVTKSE